MFLDQRDGRHHEARRAEAAHQRVAIAERLLHRMQRRAVCQTVDRANLLADRFNRERRARVCGPAVDDHRAGAADAAIASALVAGDVGVVADGVEQRHARLDPKRHALAVDHQLDRHLAGSDNRGTALRVGNRRAGDARRDRRHAGRFQELPAAAIDCFGL